MSRRGGIQAATAAMFRRLDEAANGNWQSSADLAWLLEDEYEKPFRYAQKIVRRWAEFRGEAVRSQVAGRTTFYCTRPNASLDPNVLASLYWGELPERFRKDRRWPLWKIDENDRLFLIILAHGYATRGIASYRIAFNKWAAKHGIGGIKTLAHEKT